MSKNLTRKGLALGTALAFVVTGLTATAPAYAAAGDVISVAPTTGTGWGSYNDETFSATVKIDRDVVTTGSNDKFALELTQADSKIVTISGASLGGVGTRTTTSCALTLPVILSNDATSVTVNGTATATTVTNDAAGTTACNADAAAATYSINFTASSVKYTSAVIQLPTFSGASYSVVVGTGVSDANSNVGITAWMDKDDDGVRESTDSYPSTTETIKFYDGSNVSVITRVERFSYDEDYAGTLNSTDGAEVDVFNAAGQLAATGLGVSLAFSPALNLDQVATANNLAYKVAVGTNAATTQSFTATGLNGFSTHSAAGKIYGLVTTAANLAVDTAYTVSVTKDDTVDKVNTSGAYTVGKQVDETTDITGISSIASSDTVNSVQDDTADTFAIRTGVKDITYTATSSAAKAGVAVIAKVVPTSLATGSTFTVGSTTYAKGQVALVAGTTDASGKFSVKVSTSAAKATESYKVTFFVQTITGTWAEFNAGTEYVSTYAAGVLTSVAAAADVLSGATVATTFKVKDQFGQPISVDADGKALLVKVTASNTTNLNKKLTVTNGIATLSEKNWLATGETDVISWQLGTETNSVWASSTATGNTDTIELFNPAAAATVNALAAASTNITYDDFTTGADTATNAGPADTTAGTTHAVLTGNVVDANGAGIPGAVVTLAAKGLQFQNGSDDFYQDSITFAADTSGSYSVKVWAHVVNTTGIKIAVTSGGKSGTTTLKTYLPENLAGGNLAFSVKIPAIFVKNTTYAVTAKLSDKWGNPVATAVNAGTNGITFTPTGSVEINGTSNAVAKNFDKNGVATVYARSVRDVAGPAAISAALGAANYTYSSASTDALSVAEITTDVTTTKWDETVFVNAVDTEFEVLAKAPTATIKKAATSVVTVKNAAPLTVKVVRGSKSKTVVASSNSQTVSLKGGTGTVKVYVNGVLIASKK